MSRKPGCRGNLNRERSQVFNPFSNSFCALYLLKSSLDTLSMTTWRQLFVSLQRQDLRLMKTSLSTISKVSRYSLENHISTRNSIRRRCKKVYFFWHRVYNTTTGASGSENAIALPPPGLEMIDALPRAEITSVNSLFEKAVSCSRV